MAFISNEDDEDQKGVVGGGVLAGNSASKTSGAAPATGSGWTNLQTYLDANKGKGGDVANKITTNIQDGVNKSQDTANQWETSAKAGVDSRTRQDLWSDKIKNDPTKVDQAGFNDWKSSSNYSGATNATQDQGYANAYGGVQKAQNDVKLAGDAYGQQALARQTFGKDRSYSTGQSLLDTFIARGDQAGKDQFKTFQDRNKDIGTQFDSKVKGVNDYIGGAEGRGKAAYDTTMGTIGDKYRNINSAAQGRADANTDKSKAYEHLKSSDDRSVNYSNDLWDPFVYRNSEWGADDAYTDDDVAALNSLAGMDDSDATGQVSKGNTNSPYVANTAGYKEWLTNQRSAPVYQPAPVEVSAPSQASSVDPNNQPEPGPSVSDPLPVPIPVGPTPTPTPTAPLPVPVPVGPTPAPSPTAPLPVPVPVGPTPTPTAGSTGGLGGATPITSTTRDNSTTIDYSGPRPAGWPEWMPWPVR